MIIMALDHTRDFFHADAAVFQPDDLTRTTAALFFTRWVTHICAPVFMFTAGVSAYLWLTRGQRTTRELSRFLWTRGLWLVFLDLTVMRFALTFSFTAGPLILIVLWALGWSMVALGFLAHLPIQVLAVVSILTIALHNLLDPIQAAQLGSLAWLWNILHQQGIFMIGPVTVLVAYPLIPWIAVMAAGFCFGRIMQRRWMIRLGIGLTVAFVVIRAINVYGDPFRWSTKIPGMTVLSFLRTTKYPPSLDFLLMTLGPALLIWAWLDRLPLSRTNPLVVFGRVPLFYFVVHFYVIHLLRVLTNASKDLWVVYAVWIGVVIAMYPLCLWFSRLKERRRDWWLSYL
jgi:uncharacterized membrane protein